MSPRFLVVLTEVRPLAHPDQHRDERTHPERVLERVPVADLTGAQTLFWSLCSLTPVQAGRQRPKVIALSGRDTEPSGEDDAMSVRATPLVTPAFAGAR